MKTNHFILLTMIALLVSGTNSNVMAQNQKKHAEISTDRTSETLNVSADNLWQIIRHPDISLWSTLFDSTEYFGEEVFEGVQWNKRISVVNAKGHHESHEDLIAYDGDTMEIKFASTLFPRFIISNETHWKVIDKGDGKSALNVSTHMSMKKFQAFFLKKAMLKAINKNSDGIFYDIQFYAEEGTISPVKKERIKALQNRTTNHKEYKEVKKLLSSDTINVSADSLWAICREFGKTAEWTSTLNHSYGTGEPIHEGASCSSRTCETSFGKGNKVVEKLNLFNNEKRELAYNLTEGSPGFMTFAENHWKVIEIGPNQSRLDMNITLHMKKIAGFFLGRLITTQMEKQVNIVLDEIKTYAETGEVSEAKKKQIEKQKQEN